MELFFALIFYMVFSLFALAGLPLVTRVVSHPVLALAVSKIVGLMVCGYIVWIGTFAGLLDYQRDGQIRGVVLLLLAGGATMLWRMKVRLEPRRILGIEAISFALYAFYLFIRSHHPSADGTEHFMDMALLSAAGKTHTFPFVDPWYAGKAVNYYYYGSYIVSLLSNLAGSPYAIAYNLALAVIYSQATLLAGALGFALTGLKRFGLLAGFLVTTAGTLFYAQCALRGASSSPPVACPYMSSTRLYTPSYIINEIPSYSFTVGNLHAHLIALPFFVTGLILLFAIASTTAPGRMAFILIALLTATSGMISSWDAITLLALLGTLILIKIFEHHRSPRIALIWPAFGIATVVAVIALMLPAVSHFESPVLGIGFAPGYFESHGLLNVQYPTPLGAQAGIWGAYLFATILALALGAPGIRPIQYFATLAMIGFAILVGLELVFVRDVYSLTNPPYFRANTTFKFGYHAWVILSIVFAASMASAIGQRRAVRAIFHVICFAVIAGGAVYPLAAFFQYYADSTEPRGLDASAWMTGADRETVRHINEHFRERRVIAESVGDSYSRHSRITTFTGMITPMGWPTHEWTWRFRSGEAAGAPDSEIPAQSWAPISVVTQNIERLYKTRDPAEARRIIDLYGIDYVYVGDLERQAYPDLDESKFYVIGRVEFESDGSRLFAVR